MKVEERNRLNHLLTERIPIFSKLSYEQKVRLCQYVSYEKHKKGTKIFSQGADSKYVYYVLSGQIQVTSTGVENQEFHVDYLKISTTINPDDHEGSWQEHNLRSQSAICQEKTELLCFDRRRRELALTHIR
jgi:CRP-like cAMP-binding protein